MCELEPDVGCAFVNSPTARQRVNDHKTATAHVIGAAFSHLSLKAASLVNDLTVDGVAVDTNGQGDRALTVRNGVGDKFGHHEREVAGPLAAELPGQLAVQGVSRDAGRRVVAR